jgi:type IV secretory pathway component VirB8
MRKRNFGRWANRLACAAFALMVVAVGAIQTMDVNWS